MSKTAFDATEAQWDNFSEIEIAAAFAALRELRDYAARVWFDAATATDEERELMARAAYASAAFRFPLAGAIAARIATRKEPKR